MMEDVSKSIKANLYEKASSPLAGAFSLSWFIWNYKLILTIFSGLKLKEKIEYIEIILYPDFITTITVGFGYPLLSAVLLILIYPHPAKWIYEYWHTRQKELKEIKQKIEDDTPLTIEESRQLRRELLRLESDYDEEISKKNLEVDRLKEIIDRYENKSSLPVLPSQRKDVQAPPPKKSDSIITDEQKELLEVIVKGGGYVEHSYFYNEVNFDRVKAEYLIEDLEANKYVRYEFIAAKGGHIISLTTKGKKYAVEEGFAS